MVDLARRLGGVLVDWGPPNAMEHFARRTDPDADVHPETEKRLDGLPEGSVPLSQWNAEHGDEIDKMRLVPRGSGGKEVVV